MAEKYYAKANRFYSILYWAYLGLSIGTLATMVTPAVIVTIHNYFSSEEMTEDQWSIPFYIAWESNTEFHKTCEQKIHFNFQNPVRIEQLVEIFVSDCIVSSKYLRSGIRENYHSWIILSGWISAHRVYGWPRQWNNGNKWNYSEVKQTFSLIYLNQLDSHLTRTIFRGDKGNELPLRLYQHFKQILFFHQKILE